MDKFLTLTLSGAVTGAIYSLVAAGLTLSYAATGIFNLSYGAAAFASAYVYYELNTGLGWPIVPAAVVTILVFAPLLGLLLDVAVFRPLARATEAAKVMATIGLLIAVPALTRFLLDWMVETFELGIPSGTDIGQTGFPPGLGPVPRENWMLPGDVPVDSNQLVVFVAAAGCALGLWLLLRRTALGLAMRAVVDRPDLATARGIDPRTTSRWAWMIGMSLASLAGVVGSPILGALTIDVFVTVVFVASAAAVVGGLRSIPLAFVGGILLGIAQNLVFGYATFAEDIRGFNSSVPFVILLGGLVVLARDRARRGGSAAEDVPPVDHTGDLPPWRRALPWVVATAAFLLYVLVLADDFWVSTMATGLALALIFLSFTVVTGLGGMVSLAQASFVSAAALTAGMLIGRYELPFAVALVGGAAVATAVGVAVSLPALRLGGVPLALATLALALVGDNVLFAWDWLRNGQDGWRIDRPVLGPLDLSGDTAMTLFLLVLVGATILLVRNLQRSPSGRAVLAVRASEPAAATSGVSPVRTKLAVFAVSAAIAGVGGVMLATVDGSVSNSSTPAVTGLLWLASVVLFGIRRPGAAVVAGIVTAASPVLLRSGFHWPLLPSFLDWNGTDSSDIPAILFGLGAIQLAREPDGIFALTGAQNRRRRERRRRAALARAAARPDTGPASGAPLAGDGAAATAATGTGAAASGSGSGSGSAGLPTAPGGPVPGDAGSEAVAAVAAEEERAAAEEAARLADELRRRGAVRAGSGTDAGAVPDGAAAAGGLVLEGVHAGYGNVEVLHGVDLAVVPGSITVLLGANGSGKTTLCRAAAGLVAPSAGAVRLRGEDVTGQSPVTRARSGVVVVPESRGVFPRLSVEENLAVRLARPGQRAAAYERFPVLGERRGQTAGSLSGGEQQMLALAGLLVDPPEVVVCDEPTLGLAPKVVQQVCEVVSELRDRGVALLLVEEKSQAILGVADRVALLQLGRLAWSGRAGDVDEELLMDTYLGGIAPVEAR